MAIIKPNMFSKLNGHATDLEQAIKESSDFISPEKLASAIDLKPEVVREFLELRHDLVRRADVTDQHGNPLYARANAPLTIRERWGRIYSYITKEPLPSNIP